MEHCHRVGSKPILLPKAEVCNFQHFKSHSGQFLTDQNQEGATKSYVTLWKNETLIFIYVIVNNRLYINKAVFASIKHKEKISFY